ncbi:hypothetical protein [Mycobacterium sp. 23]|uniref:hypothetical protein n=1 Tax=Mycobacterium sp. 23 TaxID=3400424 RepID=UPI003AAE86D2
MSDDIIARAEAALEGVTDGPWVAEYSGEQGNCVIPHDAQSTREAVCTTHLYYQVADAEFIAAARQLVPELVAELKTTRAQLRQVARQLGLFLEDGERNRVIVALAITDGKPEGNENV